MTVKKELDFNNITQAYWNIKKIELLKNLIEKLKNKVKTLSIEFNYCEIKLKAQKNEKITIGHVTYLAGYIMLESIETFREHFECYVLAYTYTYSDFIFIEISPFSVLSNVYLKNPTIEDLKKIKLFSEKYNIPIKRSAQEIAILENNNHLAEVLTWENFVLDDILFEFNGGGLPLYSESGIPKKFIIYKNKLQKIYSHNLIKHVFNYKVRYSFDSWIVDVEKIFLGYYKSELKAIERRMSKNSPPEPLTDRDAFDDDEQYNDFLLSR